MFCCVPVVYVLGCVLVSLERATKTDKILPVRTYKIGLIQRNPGNRRIHSRKKNFERPPRKLQSSDRAQTSTTGSGRPSCVDVVLGFWLKVLVRRDKFKNGRKFHKYTYTYKAPLRGVGCFPRSDASWHATGESYQSPSSGTRSMRVIPKERNI